MPNREIALEPEPIVATGPDGLLLGVDPPFGDDRSVTLETFAVSGWTLSSIGISGVLVSVDGTQYHAAFGLPSPFVGEELADRPGSDRSRFELRLPSEAVVAGRRKVEVTAYDLNGGRADACATVEFVSFVAPPYDDDAITAAYAGGRPAMWVETPWLGHEPAVATPLDVVGWAFSPHGIADVAAFVDGLRIEAVHGVARPDLRERFHADQWASAGFVLRLGPDDLPVGRRDVAVVAVDHAGQAVGMRNELMVVDELPEPPPLDDLSPPKQLGDERYVPKLHPLRLFAPEHHARYRWAAGAAAGKRVLDAGCGSGWGTALLAEPATEAVGLDASRIALDHAREEYGAQATFVAGDLRSLQFPDDSFDLVVCFEAIEHVRDGSRAIAEFRRVLREDGTLLLSSPHAGRSLKNNPYHVEEREPDELLALVRTQFDAVEAWLQESYATSVIAPVELAARSGDVAVPEVELRKLSATPAGGEAYTVVVAGVAPVTLAPVAVLGDAFDLQEFGDKVDMWRDRALSAEAQVTVERGLRRQHEVSELVLLRGRTSLQRELEQARSAVGQAVADRERELAETRRQVADRERDREREFADRERELAQRLADEHVARLGTSALLDEVTGSLSWRLTAPLRDVLAALRRRR